MLPRRVVLRGKNVPLFVALVWWTSSRPFLSEGKQMTENVNARQIICWPLVRSVSKASEGTHSKKGKISKNPTTMRQTHSSQEGSEDFPAARGRKLTDGEEITQLCIGRKSSWESRKCNSSLSGAEKQSDVGICFGVNVVLAHINSRS